MKPNAWAYDRPTIDAGRTRCPKWCCYSAIVAHLYDMKFPAILKPTRGGESGHCVHELVWRRILAFENLVQVVFVSGSLYSVDTEQLSSCVVSSAARLELAKLIYIRK